MARTKQTATNLLAAKPHESNLPQKQRGRVLLQLAVSRNHVVIGQVLLLFVRFVVTLI